jgi:hypothetical protein
MDAHSSMIARFASRHPERYDDAPMYFTLRRLLLAILPLIFFALLLPAGASETPAIFPLSQVQAGMKGVLYTIYSGDLVEKVDVEILGILHNALGPKQDIIVVQLLGDKAEHSGVVAGMSGSPLYIEGKLVGALSLKIGIFTKEAVGGVTPIENMLDVEKAAAMPVASRQIPSAGLATSTMALHIPLPDFAQTGNGTSGQFLIPIETPLISAGLFPETFAQFGREFSSYGMSVIPGGTAPPSPEDARIQPGDMVGIQLVGGDLSLDAGCTVTTVVGNDILACGHPIFAFGSVSIPIVRAHVVTTLASSLASTKIMTTSGTIGTLTQDRLTAVMGKIGGGPSTIPVHVKLVTPVEEKDFHFQVIESPQLTPLLVALTTFNGIVATPAYGEGSTLQLAGSIELKGHTAVRLENLFSPTDTPLPNGFLVAASVQSAFARIYSNPYELPKVERVDLRVTALPERRWAMIDSAWIEKSEVRPGETVAVKVLLRPYRGTPLVQEIPITIPAQAAHGALQLVVSDAETLNRNLQLLALGSHAQLPGLEELIKLVNRERQNDRLYATLLQPTPTLLLEDKEMPNVPLSEINVLDRGQNPGGARLLWQSRTGEWSVEMHQVIAGEHTLTITVK